MNKELVLKALKIIAILYVVGMGIQISEGIVLSIVPVITSAGLIGIVPLAFIAGAIVFLAWKLIGKFIDLIS